MNPPTPDEQAEYLLSKGWTRQSSTIWKAPWRRLGRTRALYRGPHQAWKAQKAAEFFYPNGQAWKNR